MSVGISLHGSADVVALAVCHNEHTVELCIADGLFESSYAVVSVHLIVSSLRLDGRHKVVYLIDDSLIEVEDSLCGSLQCPAVAVKVTTLNELGDILQFGVETYHRRIFQFDYFFNKSVK